VTEGLIINHAMQALKEKPGNVHMESVCQSHGLTRQNLRSWDKRQAYVRARKELWFRLKFIAGFSWPEAAGMTRKDHTTALYGVRQWANQHLGTSPKAKEAEIAAAWEGYCRAIAFLVLLAQTAKSQQVEAMEAA